TATNPITLYQATYDTCDSNMIRIIAGSYGSQATPPKVRIQTSDKIYQATLAKEQPYSEQNKVLQISRYVYEAPISKDTKFFKITADLVKGKSSFTASYLVIVNSCTQTITINPMTGLDKAQVNTIVDASRPNIFDVKVQVDASKPASAKAQQFTNGTQKVKVSAIVESKVPLRGVEIRTITAGQNYSDYSTTKMNIKPLEGMQNAYVVSADLPASVLKEPAIIYWIHATNKNEKIQVSEKYDIGVKPSYPVNARVEIDLPAAKPQGSTLVTSAYVYNKGKPFFGSVSLLVNGKAVYTSPEYVLKGMTPIDLTWEVPESSDTSYDIKARLNAYDIKIDTKSATLHTFQSTVSYPISQTINIQSVMYKQQIVARAALVYSSDANPDLHYNVVAPDGKCVIGSSDSCIIHGSTLGKRGNTESIDINGQIFRIRYSGSENPLERFSITSVDPIQGDWKVSLESDYSIVPDAHAMQETLVKIKYREMFAKPVTFASNPDA
ncbi:MAG: hypothetical protein EB161_09385, partial [Nitrosopumilaceae archaeon]|nr:hypothetical protein [Nitrosopumilaceae archaeon]